MPKKELQLLAAIMGEHEAAAFRPSITSSAVMPLDEHTS